MDRCQTISSQTGTVGDVITTAVLELRAHGYLNEAQEYALRAVEWYRNRPASMDVREDLASAFYTAEMWQDAQKLYEQLAEEFPDNIDYLGYLGALAARRGDREDAMNISEKLKQIDRPYLFGQNTYWRACIAALLGNQELAVELLKESFAKGKTYGIYLHRNIDFETLKDYLPFQELLKPKE